MHCLPARTTGHDDPNVKYDKLKAVADIFRAKRGRDPTFWCVTMMPRRMRISPLNLNHKKVTVITRGLSVAQA